MAGLSISFRTEPDATQNVAEVHAFGPRISFCPSYAIEMYRIGGLPIGDAMDLEFILSFEGGRVFATFGNGRWIPSADANGEAFTLHHNGAVTARKKVEVLRPRRYADRLVGRWIMDEQRHQILTRQTVAMLGLRAAFELVPYVNGDGWSL